MKTRIMPLLLTLPLLASPVTGYCVGHFAGRFQGGGLTFEAQGDQTNYTGTITLGTNAFSFVASEAGNGLTGSFTTPDGQFDFKATLKGDGLTLTTGSDRYSLSRQNTNPLAKGKSTSVSSDKLKKLGGGFFHRFVDSVVSGDGKIGDAAKNAALDTLVTGVAGQSTTGGTSQVIGSVFSGLSGQGGQFNDASPTHSLSSTSTSQSDPGGSSQFVDSSVPGGQPSTTPSGDAQISGPTTQQDPSTAAQPDNNDNGTQGPTAEPGNSSPSSQPGHADPPTAAPSGDSGARTGAATSDPAGKHQKSRP